MDKKYIGQTIAFPKPTIEKLDALREKMQLETGILKLSRRQVIESLILQKIKEGSDNV